MALWTLLTAVKETLEQGLSQAILEAPGRGKDYVAPQVFIGKVDPAKPPAKTDFPFVAVVPAAEQLLPDQGRAEVSLVLGVYNEGKDREDGFHDLDNLAGQVAGTFIRNRELNNQFICNLPMDSFHEVKLPHPYYLMEMVTRWVWWDVNDLPLLED